MDFERFKTFFPGIEIPGKGNPLPLAQWESSKLELQTLTSGVYLNQETVSWSWVETHDVTPANKTELKEWQEAKSLGVVLNPNKEPFPEFRLPEKGQTCGSREEFERIVCTVKLRYNPFGLLQLDEVPLEWIDLSTGFVKVRAFSPDGQQRWTNRVRYSYPVVVRERITFPQGTHFSILQNEVERFLLIFHLQFLEEEKKKGEERRRREEMRVQYLQEKFGL